MSSLFRFNSLANSYLFNLLNKKTIQIGLLIVIIFVFYFNTLFQPPRADQLSYLYQTASLHSFWQIITKTYALNRTFIGSADALLFRPLLYILLGIEKYLFGYHFKFWQLMNIFLHIGIALSLYNFCQLIENYKTSFLPFCLTLFFSLLYSNLEMVAWTHIVGYLLFCLLMINAIIFFIKWQNHKRKRDAFLLVVLTLFSAFTYELGSILAILMGIALFCDFYSKRKYENFCLGIFLALIPLIYFGVSGIDFKLRHLSASINMVVGNGLAHAVFLSFYTTTKNFIVIIFHWIVAAFIPALLKQIPGSRTTSELMHIHLTNVVMVFNLLLFIALLFSGFYFLKNQKRILRFKLEKELFFILIGLMISYVIVIAWGRSLSRGMAYILSNNSYYPYIFMLLFCQVLALSFSFGEKNIINKSQKITRLIFFSILMAITVINAAKLYTSQFVLRYDYSAPRLKLLNAVLNLEKTKGLEADFSFTVAKDCKYNDSLPWMVGAQMLTNTMSIKKESAYLVDVLFPFEVKLQNGKYLIACDKYNDVYVVKN